MGSASNSVRSGLITVILFLLILDTGDWLGIREILILCLIVIGISKNTFQIGDVNVYCFLGVGVVLLIPSIFQGTAAGITIADAIPFILPFLLFPLIYFAVTISNVNINHGVNAMLLFSGLVILLFLGQMAGIDLASQFLTYVSEVPGAGFFSERASFNDDQSQAIYFKATLLLVPFAIIAIQTHGIAAGLLLISALYIAQSKAGLLVVFCGWVFLMLLNKDLNHQRKISAVVFMLLFSFILIDYQVFFIELIWSYDIRHRHSQSAFELIFHSPSRFLFGWGAATEFYSEGFRAFSKGMEISQFEYIRRHGIIFFLYFFFAFLFIIKKFIFQKCTHYVVAIIGFFVVSATNPVLFSIPAIIFYSILIHELRKRSASLRAKP